MKNVLTSYFLQSQTAHLLTVMSQMGFKMVVVNPLIQKAYLADDDLKNYHPVCIRFEFHIEAGRADCNHAVDASYS